MKRLFYCLMLMSFVLSCSKDETGLIDYPKVDYFPLQVGNKWYYENYTVEVTRQLEIDGTEWYEMTTISQREGQESITYYAYYRKTDDGKVYRKADENSAAMLVFDLKIGFSESWAYADGDYEWTVTTGERFETITMGHAKLEYCRSYYYDIPQAADDEHMMVLAPGLGLVYSASLAWGLSDELERAVINGLDIRLQ